MTARAGVTLVELLVVLTILALIAGMTVPAFRSASATPAGVRDQLARARERAIDGGRAEQVVVRRDSLTFVVTALPDGSVLAPPTLHIARATGVVPR